MDKPLIRQIGWIALSVKSYSKFLAVWTVLLKRKNYSFC